MNSFKTNRYKFWPKFAHMQMATAPVCNLALPLLIDEGCGRYLCQCCGQCCSPSAVCSLAFALVVVSPSGEDKVQHEYVRCNCFCSCCCYCCCCSQIAISVMSLSTCICCCGSLCLPAASAVAVSLFSTLYAKALLHNAKAMAMAMAMTKRCKCCQPKVKGSIKRALQCGCNAEAVKILLSRLSSLCI